MLLGLTLAVVSLFALFLWSDARSENASVPASTTAGHDMAAMGQTGAMPLNSFAGVVPANAQALAKAHKA
jgi:hypothetical protein